MPPTLVLRGVDKRLGGRAVLTDVGLTCAAGETCVIMGANGSGKSTLLRIMVGLLEPDRGTVAIDGLAVAGASAAARRRLGYLPDATDVLPQLSVGELVALARTFKRADGDDHAPVIEALRDTLGLGAIWRQRLATLSFGQRKKALLLTALIGAPPLLVLDEPSNGLDADAVRVVNELLSARPARAETTVLCTNDQRFAAEIDGHRHHLVDGRLLPAPERHGPAPVRG